MERRQLVGGGWRLGGRRIEQKGKRTHGQQCGDCRAKVGIRGINSNAKKNPTKS